MKLKSVVDAVNCQICGSSEYLWECFGPNAKLMDFCDTNNNEIGSCVYDSNTQQVYTVEAFCDNEDTHYTWIKKDYIAAYEKEAESRGVDPYIAYDDKKTILVNKSTILSLLGSYANPKSKKSEYPNFDSDQSFSASDIKENANNLGENMASAKEQNKTTAVEVEDDVKDKHRPEEPKAATQPKLSEKEIATRKGEPWVKVISVELDPDNLGNGVFELDFNEIFVARLVKAGYTGKDDYSIVDQWFVSVCRNIVMENFEQWEANHPELSPRGVQKKDLGNGLSEIS